MAATASSTRVVNCQTEEFDVYIGRPSIWGNPFVLGYAGDREAVIEKYRRWMLDQTRLLKQLHTLRGKRLGCWCKKGQHCHGHVLIELINILPKEP